MPRLVGTALMVVGLTGFGLTMLAPRLPAAVLEPISAFIDGLTLSAPAAASAEGQARAHTQPADPAVEAVTRLVIPSIGLDTPVSVAPLVDHNGTTTWDVPKFVAGHAEGSAGAAQPGNTIIMGHVTSLTLGNVFEHLDQVKPGDVVYVYSSNSSDQPFDYRAVETRHVARTDVTVLDQSPNPTLTLVTCSGLWLPTVWDYNQRFIVRAELR